MEKTRPSPAPGAVRSPSRAAKAPDGRLAIHGGRPVWTRGWPAWPQFNPETTARVAGILESGRVNYWTGSYGLKFEAEFAKMLRVRHAVSVSSGTAALHLALTALGIGSGDEVVCTSYSFIASSFCALQAGALPVFVDAGTDHLIDPDKIAAAITPRTKAIVVVHLYGIVADMGPILKLAKKHGLHIVEDCAQCLGGTWRGRQVGTVGTVGCFSFCQSKHITTGGEGGMVCCGDDRLAAELRSLRDHGHDVEARLNLRPSRERELYFHRRVGYNFRMTEIQSAIGLGELERFRSWNLPNRRKLSAALIAALKDEPLVLHAPADKPRCRNSYWLVPFVLRTEMLGCTMPEFIAAVRAEGANVHSVLWPEMYREEAFAERRGFGAANYPFDDPAHRRIDYAQVDCPVARSLAESTISFWTHPVYTLEHIAADVAAFRKVAAAMMRKPPRTRRISSGKQGKGTQRR